jgi:hypothetical protein
MKVFTCLLQCSLHLTELGGHRSKWSLLSPLAIFEYNFLFLEASKLIDRNSLWF